MKSQQRESDVRDTFMVQRLIEMVSIIKSLLNGICVNVYCVIYVNQVGSEVKSQQRESNGFDSTFLLCLVVALSSFKPSVDL